MNIFNDILIYTYIKSIYLFSSYETGRNQQKLEVKGIIKKEGKEEFEDKFEMMKMKFK